MEELITHRLMKCKPQESITYLWLLHTCVASWVYPTVSRSKNNAHVELRSLLIIHRTTCHQSDQWINQQSVQIAVASKELPETVDPITATTASSV